MKHALIKNGVVQNVIVADQAFMDQHEFELSQFVIVSFEEGAIWPSPGDLYDGVTFTSPPPEIIEEELPPE